MIALSHELPTVEQDGRLLYGGNQALSVSKTMRECGCGAVGVLNLLLYLSRYHGVRIERLASLTQADPVPSAEFDRCALELSHRYLPLIPHHGINGLLLALGVNRIFHRDDLPYRARWGVSAGRFWSSIETMLRQDLPVILSIGPNFPLFWQQNDLQLYQRRGGSYIPAGKTRAHYVTVSAIDDEWLRVSSWGREYYLSRREYTNYVHAHSMRLVSNILYIEKN